MKKYLSDTAKSRLFSQDLLFKVALVLLFLTLLSIWLVSGIFAKYIFSASGSDAARVAAGLPPTIELYEHHADLSNGEYILDEDNVVSSNTYSKVIPGVDIAKDPFVRITGNLSSELNYHLYVKAVESNFPTMTDSSGKKIKTVTYELDTALWEKVSGEENVYKYKGTIKAGTPIYILKNNKLLVSEHYVGKGNFSLAFEAWLA